MRKIILTSVIFGLLILVSPVLAAQNGQGEGQGGAQAQQVNDASSGNQVQNANQVQTQNQGEDQQLQVSSQEQESLGDNQGSKSASPRSEKALEKMSNVAKKVEELLTTQGARGGIGEQISQFANAQNQAQSQIQEDLDSVDKRGGFMKFLIGPDYKALKSMQKQMEQNQVRIQLLEQLRNEVQNQDDADQIQETIQALVEQNTALQDRVNLEENTGSLLGWLFKLLNK